MNVMWKKTGLVIMCLVIGFVLGAFLTMAHTGHKLATAMFMLEEKEICQIGIAAEDAYYNQPNVVAVWALENYIKALNEAKEERRPAKVKNPYFILSPDIDLVFTHARLGRLYKQMGNAEKSRYHFEQAISHSKYTKSKYFSPLNTEEDCVRMLEALDKAHSKSLD
jgi:tetratricopeptide (TPR) repeat protein